MLRYFRKYLEKESLINFYDFIFRDIREKKLCYGLKVIFFFVILYVYL